MEKSPSFSRPSVSRTARHTSSSVSLAFASTSTFSWFSSSTAISVSFDSSSSDPRRLNMLREPRWVVDSMNVALLVSVKRRSTGENTAKGWARVGPECHDLKDA